MVSFCHGQALWEDNVSTRFIPNTDESEILRFLYGNYNAETKMAVPERPSEDLLSSFIQRPGKKDSISIKSISIVPTKADTTKVYVLIQADFAGNTCEKCAPVIEMALFQKRDSLWEFKTREILGAFKSPTKGKLFTFTPIGENQGAYLFKFLHDAPMLDQEQLKMYSDYAGEIKEIFNLNPSAENNKDVCDENDPPCYRLKTKLKIKANGSPFYPISIKFRGKKLTWDKKLVPIKETQVWTLKNGMYGL